MIVVVGVFRLAVLVIHLDRIFPKHLIIQMDFNLSLAPINLSWKVSVAFSLDFLSFDVY
jgi:hypothetical protein